MQTPNLTPTFFTNRVRFRNWLIENHGSETELWVGFYKKASRKPTITYLEAVEEALCFGWIDGLKNAQDEISYKIRFTPRRPRSIWSKTNVTHVERLVKAGRMQPAGLVQVEAAKADGRWAAAYEGGRNMAIPKDLEHFLDNNPQAKQFFATISASNRYACLFRLATAKKPETRTKRLQQISEMLSQGRVFHPDK